MSSITVPCPGSVGAETVKPASDNAPTSGPIVAGMPAKPWIARTASDTTAEGTFPAVHAFLSDEWVAAARALREEYRGSVPAFDQVVRINLVITAVPFGDGTTEAHVDTSGGDLFVDLGHLEGAELTLTLDYDTAKALAVEGDPQAATQAFMGGRIKTQGDLTKLLLLLAQPPTPTDEAKQLAERLRAITS